MGGGGGARDTAKTKKVWRIRGKGGLQQKEGQYNKTYKGGKACLTNICLPYGSTLGGMS